MMTEQLSPQKSTKKVELWVCDFCHTAKFEDYEDACRHEDECRKEQEENQKKSAALHPFFGKQKIGGAPAGGVRKNDNNNNSEAKGRSKLVNTKQNQLPTDRKPVRLNDSRGTTSLDLQSSSSSENTVNSAKIVGVVNQPTAKKRKSNSSSCSDSSVKVIRVAESQSKNKRKPKNNHTKPTSKANKSKTVAPLAAIFQKDDNGGLVDEKSLLAEQRAAEFQAKRRLERERERERQRKRQATFFQQKSDQLKSSTSTNNQQESKSKFSCPRFPVPSFILSSSTLNGTDIINDSLPKRPHVILNDERMERMQKVLRKKLPYPGKVHLEFTSEEDADFSFTSTLERNNNDPHQGSVMALSISDEFAKVFVPPERKDDSFTTNNNNITSWADKYAMDVKDICGDHNKQVSSDLIKFVREWMVERQLANQRMAERQRALQKKRKAKKKRNFAQDDEDLWFDSDSEECRLPSVCLIEGPVGSCKSSLVYAVARQCECQVLELNTSDKRSSANIKRALEETTQSHSSLDMLKKREANLFAGQQLVDSDVESDNEEKGDSLTMILIDEVDNVYEEYGDNGFWAAMNDLSRKALCPVFLTANAKPKGLNSANLSFRHVKTALPTSRECASKIEQLLEQEGITMRQDKSCDSAQHLQMISELCGCDIRRIINELQLFARTTRTTQPSRFMTTSAASFSAKELAGNSASKPQTTIESVSPKVVPSDRFSLLTINLQSPIAFGRRVKVVVGDQMCRSRFVDDKTLMAICPPISSSTSDEDELGVRPRSVEYTRPSLESRFVPVSRSLPSSSLHLTTLMDGSYHWGVSFRNVEYSFPNPTCHVSEFDDEDSELELDDTETAQCNWYDIRSSYLTRRKDDRTRSAEVVFDDETADHLFSEGLSRLKAKDDAILPEKPNDHLTLPCVEEGRETILELFESIARDFHLASDASLLETYSGIPLLSGASHGFGYLFTPEGSAPSTSSTKLTRHGNSTQCSEERLISLGWKDSACFYGNAEVFMDQRLSARERRLLVAAEVEGRRYFPSADISGSAVSNTNAQEQDETCSDASDLTLWAPTNSHRSEEDFLLPPQPTPVALLSLPSTLVGSQTYKYNTQESVWKEQILQRRKEAKHSFLLELLDSLCSDVAKTKMFSLGLVRFNQPSAAIEFDAKLFLDYIPILRVMALHENVAFCSDPEGEPAGNNYRRTTRKSAKRRRHYFETVTAECRNSDRLDDLTEIGRRLAESYISSE